MSDNGWAPVLRGEIYCSPRCGCGCKKADYDNAVVRGEALEKLLGEGWQAEVWENGGWHVRVEKGVCTIYDHSERAGGSDYLLMMNFDRFGSSASTPQLILDGNDPVELLGLAKQDARTWIARAEHRLGEIG